MSRTVLPIASIIRSPSTTCFVNLSPDLNDQLLSQFPLPSPGSPFAVETPSNAPCFVLKLQLPVNPSIPPIYLGWTGSTSRSNLPIVPAINSFTTNSFFIEVSAALAHCLSIHTDQTYYVSIERIIPPTHFATSLIAQPIHYEDWEMVELNSQYIENNLLRQTAVVMPHTTIPIWISNQRPIFLRLIPSTTSQSAHNTHEAPFYVLTHQTELYVTPLVNPKTNNDHTTPHNSSTDRFRFNKQAIQQECAHLFHYRVTTHEQLIHNQNIGSGQHIESNNTVYLHPIDWKNLKELNEKYIPPQDSRELVLGWLLTNQIPSGKGEDSPLIGPCALMRFKPSSYIPSGSIGVPKFYRDLYMWPIGSFIYISNVFNYPVMVSKLYISPIFEQDKKIYNKTDGDTKSLSEFLHTEEGLNCLKYSFVHHLFNNTNRNKNNNLAHNGSQNITPVWDGSIVPIPLLKRCPEYLYQLYQINIDENANTQTDSAHPVPKDIINLSLLEDDLDDFYISEYEDSEALEDTTQEPINNTQLDDNLSLSSSYQEGVLASHISSNHWDIGEIDLYTPPPEPEIEKYEPYRDSISEHHINPITGEVNYVNVLVNFSSFVFPSTTNKPYNETSLLPMAMTSSPPNVASFIIDYYSALFENEATHTTHDKNTKTTIPYQKFLQSSSLLPMYFIPNENFLENLRARSIKLITSCLMIEFKDKIDKFNQPRYTITKPATASHSLPLVLNYSSNILISHQKHWWLTGCVDASLSSKYLGFVQFNKPELSLSTDVSHFLLSPYCVNHINENDIQPGSKEIFNEVLHTLAKLVESQLFLGPLPSSPTISQNTLLFENPCLLCGPTNSGKSTLISNLGHTMNLKYGVFTLVVRCKALSSEKFKLETIRQFFSAIFATLVNYGPSLLILDDLDKLCPTNSNEEGITENIAEGRSEHLAEFISELILHTLENMPTRRRVSFIAVISSLSSLNKALRNSMLFDECVDIPILDNNKAKHCLRLLIKKIEESKRVQFEPEIFNFKFMNELVAKTSNFLISDYQDWLNLSILEHRSSNLLNNHLITNASNQGSHTKMITKENLLATLKNYNGRLINKNQFLRKETNWDDIGGLFRAKETLLDLFEIQLKFDFLTKYTPQKLQRGAILVGPSGCGKTLLVEGLANYLDLRCIRVNGPELLSKYIGQSEESVRTVFEQAQSSSPCLLFFDEIDSLAPKRGQDSTGVTDRVVNQLLCYLDGIEDRKDVYILAASSRPDLIDPALLRPGRLDKICYCGIPDFEEKLDILSKCNIFDWDSKTIHEACSRFPNLYTPADIQGCMQRVRLYCAQKYNDIDIGKIKYSENITELELFDIGLSQTKQSFSMNDIVKLHSLFKPFLNEKEIGNLKQLEMHSNLLFSKENKLISDELLQQSQQHYRQQQHSFVDSNVDHLKTYLHQKIALG